MSNSDQLSLDIALATYAHAMFASLLSPEEKKRVTALRTPEELIDLAAKNASWGESVSALATLQPSAEDFSAAIDRSVYAEFMQLYTFSTGSATEYLHFSLLRFQCSVITAALRRLASLGEREHPIPIPPELTGVFKPELARYNEASSYADILALSKGGIYYETLSALPVNGDGMPDLTEASFALEARYYSRLAAFLKESYTGPDRQQLIKLLGFQADIRNVEYLLRLRRFRTPEKKALALLLPIRGALTDKSVSAILSAPDEESATALIFNVFSPQLRRPEGDVEPERALRAALEERCRRAVRGIPTLSAVDAYIYLKETEGQMLKRVYTALKYGLDPATYM